MQLNSLHVYFVFYVKLFVSGAAKVNLVSTFRDLGIF